MLPSINHLFGNKLGALDGEIGQVKDVYFDDEDWATRISYGESKAYVNLNTEAVERSAAPCQ
jgi:hypothetical protein